jgi:hypothetical protein
MTDLDLAIEEQSKKNDRRSNNAWETFRWIQVWFQQKS